MTTFTNVFGGGIPPSELAYAAYSISANAELVWPENFTGANLLVANILEMTATVPALTLMLPPADSRSVGADIIVRNIGAEDIEIIDQDSNSLTTVPAGEVKLFYITDNSDPAGTWGIFDYGAGTSSADASALAGYGLRVWLAKLVPDHSYIEKNADYTVVDSDRNKLINVTVGTTVISLTAAATLEAGFHVLIRNTSLGSVTIDPAGAELIDGAATKTLMPNESAIVVSSGAGWYTVGYGRDVEFTFSEFVINAAGGSVALSASDVAGRMIRVAGVAAGNIVVTLPAIDNIYFVNIEDIGVFTVTFTTGSGDTAVLSADQRTVLYSDGTNVQVALTTAIATSLSLGDGSAAVPSIGFALDPDTGIYRIGANQLGFTANGTQSGSIVQTGFGAINGSAANPSYTFLNDQNTGFYSQAADEIGVTVNGARIGVMTSAGYLNIAGSAAAPSYKFITDEDTGMYSLGGGIIGFSGNGVEAVRITGGNLVNGIKVAAGGIDEFPAYSFLDNGAAGLGYLGAPGTISLSSGASGFGEVYISQTKVNVNFGNLEFGSALASQQRIRADFSNATIIERIFFQNNVTNGNTNVGAIPNGTATTSAFHCANNSTPTNASVAVLRATATTIDVTSSRYGAGSYLPLTFQTSDLVRMNITVAGNVEITNYSKLGSGAPATQKKKLTGTTNAAAGGVANAAHGLTLAKIIGVQVLVGTTTKFHPGSPTAANAYQVSIDATNVIITNGASSGANINNQAFSVLVEYEE